MGYGMDEEDWGDAALDDIHQHDMVNLSKAYSNAGNSEVGATIRCPVCNFGFVKKTVCQRFCNRKTTGRSTCKDVYHNTTNPRGFQIERRDRE